MLNFCEFDLPHGAWREQNSAEALSRMTDSVGSSGSSKRKRSNHQWSNEETNFFLSLMKEKDGELGFFDRIKRKKVSRVKAISEIVDEMVRHGFEMTGTTVENNWKSLLSSFRQVEEHNGQTGNDRMPEGLFHRETADIIGERTSTRPRGVVGSGIPYVRPTQGASRLASPEAAPDIEMIDETVELENETWSPASSSKSDGSSQWSCRSSSSTLVWPPTIASNGSGSGAHSPAVQVLAPRVPTGGNDSEKTSGDEGSELTSPGLTPPSAGVPGLSNHANMEESWVTLQVKGGP